MIRKVKSFAKINLFLYVTSRRKDGYHNLYSLMTQIDLCDDIYLDFSKKELSIVCDHPYVPEDDSNLAYKAAVLFYHSLKTHGFEEKKSLSIDIITCQTAINSLIKGNFDSIYKVRECHLLL